MKDILIKTRLRDFKVTFVNNFSFLNKIFSTEHYLVVVGTNVYKFYKDEIFDKIPKDKLLILKLDEQRKTLYTVTKIYEKLLTQTARRNITLISFGGGINQDVTGFVASTIYRGINWIFIPTTLLAMADSAIGLKTSLNFGHYKNMVGGFYPPSEIYINVAFLKTLKKSAYASGIGEIVKFMLMKEDPLRTFSETVNKIDKLKKNDDNIHALKMIRESIEIKKSYMEGDEFDLGRRNLLNYGHELGHSLEATSHFRIPHGIGVLIGIMYANLVASRRKWIPARLFTEINEKLLLPNISIKLKKRYFDIEAIYEKMKKDKKRVTKDLPLILPKGRNFELIKITDLRFDEFKTNLAQLTAFLSPYLSN